MVKNKVQSIMIPVLHNQTGFTLLELLIVVFILSAIAFSTVSFTTTADDQFRFEDTKTRLNQLRQAVIGQPTQMLNGEPAVSGFVADVGRLPDTIQELLENDCATEISCWALDANLNLWAGWNGPYLPVLPEQSTGERAFRDGWGNAGAAGNYGWGAFTIDQDAGTVIAQSLGSDGAPNPSVVADYDAQDSYQRDFPPTSDPSNDPTAPPDPIIIQNDHQLDMRTILVTLANPGDGLGASLPASATDLRLRVYYPIDGNFDTTNTWPATDPERDNADYISDIQSLSAGEVPDGSSVQRTFSLPNDAPLVPWGVRALEIVENNATADIFPSTGVRRSVTLVPHTPPPTTITWNIE